MIGAICLSTSLISLSSQIIIILLPHTSSLATINKRVYTFLVSLCLWKTNCFEYVGKVMYSFLISLSRSSKKILKILHTIIKMTWMTIFNNFISILLFKFDLTDFLTLKLKCTCSKQRNSIPVFDIFIIIIISFFDLVSVVILKNVSIYIGFLFWFELLK